MMRILLYIAAIFLLISCHKDDTKTGYYADFHHNGTKYLYTTDESRIHLLVSDTDPRDFINVTQFFRGGDIHLTIITGTRLQDTVSIEALQAAYSGDVEWTLDEYLQQGVVYFAPYFHAADNGGFLAIDGNEFVIAFINEQSGLYESQGMTCFDVVIRFDYVFANTLQPDCGPETVSCENLFEAGEMKTRFCL